MTILLTVVFTLLGIAIGSFLNVCIDRLPRKRLLYMDNGEGERLDIEVIEGVFDEDPIEMFKGKTVYVTGKIEKNISTGNLQINVTEESQIIVQEETIAPEKEKTNEELTPISWKEASNRIGAIVTICGRITGGIKIRQSLAYPPSHCDGCQQRLKLIDLVPILSYLGLRGRCRYCRAKIPRRVLLVEVASGLIFFLAFWRFGLSAQFAITAFWSCVFLIIIFIDWEYKLILNRLTYPAAVLALAVLAVDSLLPEAGILGNLRFVPQPSILSGIIAGAIGFVFFLIVFLINPRGIGMGDIKLAGLIGLVAGFPLGIVALFIGIFIGGLVAIVILALRIKGRKDVISYGTFLAIGPIITLLWGNEIFHWYQGLFK